MKSATKLFCLAALAASLLAGCGSAGSGGSTPTPPPTPTPTPTVAIKIARPAVLGENGVKVNLAYNVTLTNSAGSDTAFSCASGSANLLVVNDATGCVFTPAPAPATGDATVTVTAHADNSVTASFTVHVGDYILLESQQYGWQLVNRDVTAPPVTILTNNQNCTYAAFGRDLQRIVCVDIMSPGPTVINQAQTDGTLAGTALIGKGIDLSSLGPTGNVSVFTPAYSPDGTKITFTAIVGHVWGVYTMNLDGSGVKALITMTDNYQIGVVREKYSPDGTQILYRDLASLTEYSMNAVDGSNPHQIVSTTSEYAMYSPDMKTLYYTWGQSGQPINTYVLDVATKSVIATLTGYDIYGVSPDGKTILLQRDGNAYLADANGTNVSSTPLAVAARGSWW